MTLLNSLGVAGSGCLGIGLSGDALVGQQLLDVQAQVELLPLPGRRRELMAILAQVSHPLGCQQGPMELRQ